MSRRGGGRLLAAAAATCLLAGCGGGASTTASTGSQATTTRALPPALRAWARVKVVPPPPGVRHVGGGTLGTQSSLGGVSVPVNPTSFRLTNFWDAERHGVYIDVLAGAALSHPNRGVLIVYWTKATIGLPEPRSGAYPAPPQAGPLTIENVRGNVVYVRFLGGRGTFDLATRRYTIHGRFTGGR